MRYLTGLHPLHEEDTCPYVADDLKTMQAQDVEHFVHSILATAFPLSLNALDGGSRCPQFYRRMFNAFDVISVDETLQHVPAAIVWTAGPADRPEGSHADFLSLSLKISIGIIGL